MELTNLCQKYSSANTSINSKKLPAIYNMIKNAVDAHDTVLDYGCGKYFSSYNLGSNYFGYDPYNRNDPSLLDHTYDIALCSNVLNVIMERSVRINLLKTLRKLATKSFITIYEGDGSGVGKPTKTDCFQLNKKRRDYLPELIEVFGADHVSYNTIGYFECWKGDVYEQ